MVIGDRKNKHRIGCIVDEVSNNKMLSVTEKGTKELSSSCGLLTEDKLHASLVYRGKELG